MGVMSDLHSQGARDEVPLFGDMEPIPPDDPEEYAAAVVGIQRGLDGFAAGRHRSLEAVFADMEARHGILTRDVNEPEAAVSPFDVEGVDTGVTREQILEAIHDGRNSDRW